MKVKFWGTRGSIPTPQPDAMKYGGDTPCVEVWTDDGEPIIFDGGTGIRRCGLNLLKSKPEVNKGYIFLSHLHWDHIQGLPFFVPLYNSAYTFTIYGPIRVDQDLEHRLSRQMSELFFPVTLEQIQDNIIFQGLVEEPVNIGTSTITPRYINHPEGAFGYRLECGGKSIVYAPDIEQPPEVKVAEDVKVLVEGTDVLIFDSMYTPDEYYSHKGWGHSTWETACKIAGDFGVKQLVLFHHSPDHTDDMIDAIVKEARKLFPNTIAASRDLEIEL